MSAEINKGSRVSALDEVSADLPKWLQPSTILCESLVSIDEEFSIGTPLRSDLYVKRPHGTATADTYEKFAANQWFPNHTTRHISTLLIGHVGCGKSTFVRHVAQEVLPNLPGKSVSVIIDSRSVSERSLVPEDEFENRAIQAVEEGLTSGPVPVHSSMAELNRALTRYLTGEEHPTPSDIASIKKTCGLKEYFSYLLSGIAERVFVVLDNIDDSTQQAIEAGKALAIRIAKLCEQNLKVSSCVCVTMRNYSYNRYYLTESFQTLELTSPDLTSVVHKRLDALRQRLESLAKESASLQGGVADGPSLKITRANLVWFLKEATVVLLAPDRRSAVGLVQRLGGGNLKHTIGNFYNLLSSNKLPHVPLFKVMISRERPVAQEDLFPFGAVVGCLLSIRYPFFDRDNSKVFNIFNVRQSRAPNNFMNTLVVPRMLFYMKHLTQCSWSELQGALLACKYDYRHVIAAAELCVKYGLLTASHGTLVREFSSDCQIRTTEAVTAYLDELALEISYIQCVCEDTWMPSKYVVGISEKYDYRDFPGHLSRRLASVRNFLKFLKEEEEREQEFLKKQGISLEHFQELHTYQNEKGHSVSMHDMIESRVGPQMAAIERAH